MSEATAAVDATNGIAAATERTTAAITQVSRRLWLAGLGALAVAAEQAQIGFKALEHKGEEIEPTVAAPIRRASVAASNMAERAGRSVRSVGDAVSHATTNVTAATRWMKSAEVSEQLEKIVDEKLSAALERLDLPTRDDFRALADRIDELAPRSKRGPESHD